MRRKFIINFLLVLIGIVIGTFVAQMTSGVDGLRWLSYAISFGTSSPLAVDLNVISFSIGLVINISISVIIFVAVSLLLGKLILRK